MDYYETLGVNHTTQPTEIKQAYRKLASKHHPDKGGDPEQFKKIQEAWDVLGDVDKKREYDNPAPKWESQIPPDFGDLFGNIFNGRGRQQKNPDGQINIEISLLEAYEGMDYHINFPGEELAIKIAPGTRHGAKLRLHGKANRRFQDLPPGDLYINVLIRDEINWGRQGDDLYVNIVIDALDAIVGCDTIVKHINGKQFKVKIPAGTQEQERVRLVGQGMPHPSSGEVGALYAIINIEVPNILDKEIITLLNTIREKRGNNGS